MAEEPNEAEAKLQGLIEKSHQVLFEAKAMFPFQLFPDHIVIDRNKVTVEKRDFLRREDVHTILADNIDHIDLDFTLFLATIKLAQKIPSTELVVPFFRKADAVRIKQIITGLLIAKSQHVNLEEVAAEGLADKLVEIGRPFSSK